MKKFLLNLLIFLCAVVFFFSAFYIVRYYITANRSSSEFADLAGFVEQQGGQEQEEEQEVDPRLLAYADLAAQNSDMVGWIKIEGTLIDYPVMHTPDDAEYYLNRNFARESSAFGTPFVDSRCEPATADNIVIYGHNMKNGSMFAALTSYKSYDFYLEHSIINFDTLDEIGRYEILAVFLSAIDSSSEDFYYYLFYQAADEAEFDEFVNTAKQRSLYDTGVSAQYGDKLITLSTCEYSRNNGRMVVVAKKIIEE